MVFWLIIPIGTGILIVILSLQVVASGQLLLAIRQIALNTGTSGDTPKFKTLNFISKLNNFVGWLGVLTGILVIIIGSSFILRG